MVRPANATYPRTSLARLPGAEVGGNLTLCGACKPISSGVRPDALTTTARVQLDEALQKMK